MDVRVCVLALADSTDAVNELTKQRLAEQAQQSLKRGDTVAVLGMAYRPGTYIVEESAGLHVAKVLKDGGCRVLVHDCAATPQNSPSLLQFEVLSQLSMLKGEKNLKAVLICCPWPEYKQLTFPKGTKVFDPWGVRA